MAACVQSRVVIVLWSGCVGGTETVMSGVAQAFARMNQPCGVLFIGSAGAIGQRLDDAGVRYVSLGLTPRSALPQARRLASAMTGIGESAAILPSLSWLALAARIGGYRGRIISVDHGALDNLASLPIWQRLSRWLSRDLGLLATDVQVGVSDYLVMQMLAVRHARQLARVYNGVDTAQYRPRNGQHPKAACVFGFAGRLIHGKGLPELLRAFASIEHDYEGSRLLIAGDGPERGAAVELARTLALQRVDFLGSVQDMPAFWRSVDVAVVPSGEFIETFGMVAVEAMSTGLPVVATLNGALPEVVLDGVTGALVRPGDPVALAEAMARYCHLDGQASVHGLAGRERCLAHFDIQRTAKAYMDLARGETPVSGQT